MPRVDIVGARARAHRDCNHRPALDLAERAFTSSASRMPITMRSRAALAAASQSARSDRSGLTGPKCAFVPSRAPRRSTARFARIAVTQRARAAELLAVIPPMRARCRRNVPETTARAAELPVEIVEHDAGLDHAAALGDIELDPLLRFSNSR